MPRPLSNRYTQIIETIFLAHYKPGAWEVNFARDELASVATQLGIERPLNLGDVVYSFRFRTKFPTAITRTAPAGQ